MAKKVQARAHVKNKYAAELERIRALSSISRIIKKSDVESALISEIERDSESARTANVDKLLNQLMEEDKRHDGERKLDEIEKLTTGEGEVKLSKIAHKAKVHRKAPSHKPKVKHKPAKRKSSKGAKRRAAPKKLSKVARRR